MSTREQRFGVLDRRDYAVEPDQKEEKKGGPEEEGQRHERYWKTGQDSEKARSKRPDSLQGEGKAEQRVWRKPSAKRVVKNQRTVLQDRRGRAGQGRPCPSRRKTKGSRSTLRKGSEGKKNSPIAVEPRKSESRRKARNFGLCKYASKRADQIELAPSS